METDLFIQVNASLGIRSIYFLPITLTKQFAGVDSKMHISQSFATHFKVILY